MGSCVSPSSNQQDLIDDYSTKLNILQKQNEHLSGANRKLQDDNSRLQSLNPAPSNPIQSIASYENVEDSQNRRFSLTEIGSVVHMEARRSFNPIDSTDPTSPFSDIRCDNASMQCFQSFDNLNFSDSQSSSENVTETAPILSQLASQVRETENSVMEPKQTVIRQTQMLESATDDLVVSQNQQFVFSKTEEVEGKLAVSDLENKQLEEVDQQQDAEQLSQEQIVRQSHEREIAQLKTKLSNQEEKLEKKREKFNAFREQIKNAQTVFVSTQKQNQQLKLRAQQVQTLNNQYKQNLSNIEREKDRKIFQLESQLDSKLIFVEQLEKQLQENQDSINSLTKQVEDVKNEKAIQEHQIHSSELEQLMQRQSICYEEEKQTIQKRMELKIEQQLALIEMLQEENAALKAQQGEFQVWLQIQQLAFDKQELSDLEPKKLRQIINYQKTTITNLQIQLENLQLKYQINENKNCESVSIAFHRLVDQNLNCTAILQDQNLKSEQIANLNRTIVDLKSRLNKSQTCSCYKQIAKLQEQICDYQQLDQQNQQLSNKIVSLYRLLQDVQQQLITADQQTRAMEHENAKAKEVAYDYSLKLRHMTNSQQEMVDKLFNLQEYFANKKTEGQALENLQLNFFKSNLQMAENQIDSLQCEIQSYIQNIDDKNGKIETLRSELEHCQYQIMHPALILQADGVINLGDIYLGNNCAINKSYLIVYTQQVDTQVFCIKNVSFPSLLDVQMRAYDNKCGWLDVRVSNPFNLLHKNSPLTFEIHYKQKAKQNLSLLCKIDVTYQLIPTLIGLSFGYFDDMDISQISSVILQSGERRIVTSKFIDLRNPKPMLRKADAFEIPAIFGQIKQQIFSKIQCGDYVLQDIFRPPPQVFEVQLIGELVKFTPTESFNQQLFDAVSQCYLNINAADQFLQFVDVSCPLLRFMIAFLNQFPKSKDAILSFEYFAECIFRQFYEKEKHICNQFIAKVVQNE